MGNNKFTGLNHFLPFTIGLLFGYSIQLYCHHASKTKQKKDDIQFDELYKKLVSIQDEIERLKLILSKISPATDDTVDKALKSPSDEDLFFDTSEILDNAIETSNFSIFIAQIDQMFEDEENVDRKEIYTFLKENFDEYQNNPDYLWRLAKATYLLSKTDLYGSGATKDLRKKIIYEALEYAKKALKLNDQNGDCHKWYALTIGAISDFVSVKERVTNGMVFKEHLDIAMSIKVDDPTLYHLAGRFCSEMLSLSWIERSIANTFFGALPQVTPDDALQFFYKANQLRPEWKENLYFIAKMLIASGDQMKASSFIKKALTLPSLTSEDRDIDEKLRKEI